MANLAKWSSFTNLCFKKIRYNLENDISDNLKILIHPLFYLSALTLV